MSSAPSLNALGRLLLAPVQAVAISRRALHATGDELAALVGEHLPTTSTEDIRKGLHDSHLQRELFLSRDVGLWGDAHNIGFRLIDYSPPDSIEHAIWFANRARPRGQVCRFCGLEDYPSQLLTEEIGTTRSFIHRPCRRAALVWASWARAGVTQKVKATAAPMWWQVLELDRPNASDEEIEIAFKRASMKAHPDRGGSDAAMEAVNAARTEALGSRTRRSKVKTKASSHAG